ncbi:hypothetical protein CKO19_12285 [Rhodovulum adriaticum]|nr:hypothetical protein [Rhodovulum adriaticum]
MAQLSKLYELLSAMERDLGMDQLSGEERRIVYAMSEMADADAEISSRDLREHAFCRDISTPTYYRALKRLTARGMLTVPRGRKTGAYRLTGIMDEDTQPRPGNLNPEFP